MRSLIREPNELQWCHGVAIIMASFSSFGSKTQSFPSLVGCAIFQLLKRDGPRDSGASSEDTADNPDDSSQDSITNLEQRFQNCDIVCIGVGCNGSLPHMTSDTFLENKVESAHAEENALRLLLDRPFANDTVAFVTLSPCDACSRLLEEFGCALVLCLHGDYKRHHYTKVKWNFENGISDHDKFAFVLATMKVERLPEKILYDLKYSTSLLKKKADSYPEGDVDGILKALIDQKKSIASRFLSMFNNKD